MRSAYIIGGPGSGKSTFTAELLSQLAPEPPGPLEDLLTLPNKKNDVTLRGHRLANDGMYLGVMRESFPGTDGLDRASSPVGEAWLRNGEGLPRWLVAEGATLCTRRFLGALERYTDFLLVCLYVDPAVAVERFAARGSNQDEKWVRGRNTAARNRAEEHAASGGRILALDTDVHEQWAIGLDIVGAHLTG